MRGEGEVKIWLLPFFSIAKDWRIDRLTVRLIGNFVMLPFYEGRGTASSTSSYRDHLPDCDTNQVLRYV